MKRAPVAAKPASNSWWLKPFLHPALWLFAFEVSEDMVDHLVIDDVQGLSHEGIRIGSGEDLGVTENQRN